ncbi:hypothetical protein [Intestinibacter sp.]
MKKMLIYAPVLGLAVGVICWLFKKEKSNSTASKHIDNKETYAYENKEDCTQRADAIGEMYQYKSESVQNVSDRHSEAGEIMKNAYQNIMEDFVEDLYDKKDANETKETVIDSEYVSIMNEIDSISDDLDDLLK